MGGGNDRQAATAAELFDLLWETLADIVGTAATATLVRRSITRAASRTTGSDPVVIARDGPEYVYRLPDTWREPGNDQSVEVLRMIAAELRLLLVELTGRVAVVRLGQMSALRKWGIDFGDGSDR